MNTKMERLDMRVGIREQNTAEIVFLKKKILMRLTHSWKIVDQPEGGIN